MPTLPTALNALATRLDTLPQQTRLFLATAIGRAGAQLAALNREYLRNGERPDGSPISSRGYSPAYAAFKKKFGKFKQTGFVDLQFSGDFLDSFTLLFDGGLRFHLEATDAKAGFLAKYGELLGLREADVQDFVTAVLEPAVRGFIEQYMRG